MFVFIAWSIGLFSICKTGNAQWIECDGPYYTYIYSLASNGTDIYAAAQNSNNADGVFRSTNNGVNFIQTSLTSGINCVAVFNNKIYAGHGSWGGIYSSTNNGLNWTQSALTGKIVFTLFVNDNIIYAGTDYASTPHCSFWYSTNNGNNWIETNMNFAHIGSISIIGNTILAGGGGSSGLYRSTNNGINWTINNSINQIIHCFAVSGNNVFAGTHRGGVYLSTNGGNNWIQRGLSNKVIHSIVITGNYIFASADSSGVFLSTDNGLTWLNRNQGFNSNVMTHPLLLSNGFIFAGTYKNSVWRRSFSDIIGIRKISNEIPSAFSLNQNYPNPFNPITEIEFRLPKLSQVKLSVFNILGKEIQTIINDKLDAGYYKTEFDGSNYSSGIYFYKIITNEFAETRRMILVK